MRPSTSGFSAGSRWGDYSGTNSDPVEPGAFWGIGEFTQSSSIWQTYIAKYVPDKSKANVALVFIANTTNATFNALSFKLETSVNTPNVTQTAELFNFESQTFESIDTRPVELEDTRSEIELAGDVSRFVAPASGLLQARVSFKATGTTLFFSMASKR